MIEIRKATTQDAAQIVQVMADAEQSGSMLFSPGERQITAEGLAKMIANLYINGQYEDEYYMVKLL